MEYSTFGFNVKALDAMGSIEAYVSTFKNVDRQGDRVVRGAFKDTLEETGGKFPLLMGHNTGRIVGFSTEAAEDAHGLKIWGQLTLDADEGRNCYAICKHAHHLSQPMKMSIGYGIRPNGATYEDKTKVRNLVALDLYEASFVCTPANPRAEVTAVKSVEQWTAREFEQHLRDVGFSQEAAKRIVAAGYKALGDRRDGDASNNNAWLDQVLAVQSEVSRHKFLKEF